MSTGGDWERSIQKFARIVAVYSRSAAWRTRGRIKDPRTRSTKRNYIFVRGVACVNMTVKKSRTAGGSQ